MANGQNKIRMLPDNWTYSDYFAYVRAYQTGDSGKMFDLAQKLIVQWDYKVDLALPNAIGELGVEESAEVIRTVMETVGQYMESLDVSDVKVAFGAWNTNKFMAFDELRRTGKFAQTERMVYDIVIWDGLPERNDDGTPVSEFTFTQGAKVYKAITEKYKRVVTGKN